jgi:hypothetical protein
VLEHLIEKQQAEQELRLLVTGLSPQKPGFNLKDVLVDKVAPVAILTMLHNQLIGGYR